MKKFLLVTLSIFSIAIGLFLILFGAIDIANPEFLMINIVSVALGIFFVALPIWIKIKHTKNKHPQTNHHSSVESSSIHATEYTIPSQATLSGIDCTQHQAPPPAKSAPPTTATPAKKIEKPIMKGNFISAGGLDIPNGVKCLVSFYEHNIQIDALGQEFSLPHAKIKNVSLSTVKEIQKQYVSSIGGALAGGYLLGPLGALIGGAAKQKTIRNNTKFLIFSYIPNEQNPEMKYIVFEVPASSERRAKDFADAYKVRNKKSKTHIDL